MLNSPNEARWSSLLRTVSQVFGPRRVAVIGDAPGLAESLVSLAGPLALPPPGVVAQVGIVVAELSELAVLLNAHPPLDEMFAVVRLDSAPTERPLRARVEQIFIDAGYIKSPATNALLDYAQMDANSSHCLALFAYLPLRLAPGETTERMKIERDLHADMLREAGVRSDAHVVRYQLAATLVKPGDRVADAACGLGYGSHVLACLSEASHVTGIDLSDWGVEHARRNYADERVAFECGSLPDALAGVQESTYDFVVSLETLEHVDDPALLLRAFWRTLKPGGRIFVSVPNDWADETGKDPNPHHLHVYDWHRLKRELEEAQFIVESAWSLTASGCKTGADRRWRPQPRKLVEVPLQEADETEGEWWLACAMKSPLVETPTPYEETVHVGFDGRTSLVDFKQHYENPWIVHAMVELPWRVRDKPALAQVSRAVAASATEFSADRGAALAVKGYRLLEGEKLAEEMSSWLAQVTAYLALAHENINPHVRRWGVSLAYLRARIHEARGEELAALEAYRQVLDVDVRAITPTLGTKQADAALRSGMIAFRDGRSEDSISVWQHGLKLLFQCLQVDPIEFIGNREVPFVFSMNDLVEIADGATRLANAIHAVAGGTHASAVPRRLGMVAQHSLRSAVSSLQISVRQMSAELITRDAALEMVKGSVLALQGVNEALAENLAKMDAAKTTAERFAYERMAQLDTQSAQLEVMTQAKDVAERIALDRAQQMDDLQRALAQMEAAKENAEQLARRYADQMAGLEKSLEQMEAAKEHAEQLARTYSGGLGDVQNRLEISERGRLQAEVSFASHVDEMKNVRREMVALADMAMMLEDAQERLVAVRASKAYRLLGRIGLAPKLEE
jgi:2-polyprenyl-3-methyl-5-hydroxy-6-metoxy-1,4-benzoquinol methylase